MSGSHQTCEFWNEDWIIEDYSGDGSGTLLSIVNKKLGPCNCRCNGELICNAECHNQDSTWIATCTNGLINEVNDGNEDSPLTGVVNENTIFFKYGDKTSNGSRE